MPIKTHDHLIPIEDLRDGDTVVELGAHEGRTLVESGLLNRKLSFVLYEPGEVVAQLAEVTRGSKVTIHRKAVVGKPVDGLAMYYAEVGLPRRGHGNGNSLFPQNLSKEFVIRYVAASSPTEILKENGINEIKLLLLNVEGAEYGILADTEFMKCVNWVSCEFHPGKMQHDTREFIERNIKSHTTVQLLREGEPYNLWLGKRKPFDENCCGTI